MDWKFIVTIAVAVAFGVIAIVQGLKLAKKRKPSWAYQTIKVIGLGSNAPPELKLTFGDVLVNEVYRTIFIFFNAGKEPIRAHDDVTKPINVHFGNAQILLEPLIRPSNNEIEFVAKRVNDCIEMSFKYLDHQDGAVVEVLHTRSNKLDCQGKIIGASKISYLGSFKPTSLIIFGKVMAGLFIPFLAIFVIMEVLTFKGTLSPNSPLALIPFVLFFLGGATGRAFFDFLLSRRFPGWSQPVKEQKKNRKEGR